MTRLLSEPPPGESRAAAPRRGMELTRTAPPGRRAPVSSGAPMRAVQAEALPRRVRPARSTPARRSAPGPRPAARPSRPKPGRPGSGSKASAGPRTGPPVVSRRVAAHRREVIQRAPALLPTRVQERAAAGRPEGPPEAEPLVQAVPVRPSSAQELRRQAPEVQVHPSLARVRRPVAEGPVRPIRARAPRLEAAEEAIPTSERLRLRLRQERSAHPRSARAPPPENRPGRPTRGLRREQPKEAVAAEPEALRAHPIPPGSAWLETPRAGPSWEKPAEPPWSEQPGCPTWPLRGAPTSRRPLPSGSSVSRVALEAPTSFACGAGPSGRGRRRSAPRWQGRCPRIELASGREPPLRRTRLCISDLKHQRVGLKYAIHARQLRLALRSPLQSQLHAAVDDETA
jgi:hypothetical protein